jgi:hypothetical protein
MSGRYRGVVTKEPAKDLPKPPPKDRDERVKIDADPEDVLRVLLRSKPKRNGKTPTPQ